MTDHAPPPPASERSLVLPALAVLILAYFVAMFGGGAAWLASLNEHHVEAPKVVDAHAPAAGAPAPAKDDHAAPAAHGKKHGPPPVWMAIPFALLLAAIAIFPLWHKMEHWWEQNSNKLKLAGGLGLITVLYYLVAHGEPVESHFLGHGAAVPNQGGPSWGVAGVILKNAILGDFIPFIVLLFSLYTIAGGIRIQGDLPAHPGTNTAIMGIGALIASFIGTTGAAMLLVRLLVETNSERKRVAHTMVFFIFIVCNAGGLLLPLGDPPLFLGYLKGVEFFWTLKLVGSWIFVNGLLLAIYYLWDANFEYPKEAKKDIQRDETHVKPLKFAGAVNVLFLLGVLLSVILLDSSKPLVGTAWKPWVYLREVVQLVMVALSLLLTPKAVREGNNFNYGAIQEVACLFIGIFLCMQPPLQYLDANGGKLGLKTETHFFWATGILSSVLDNAPTYLVFMETAKVVGKDAVGPKMAEVPEPLLAAVSLGAVLMGAVTYIGNGPNFMVKAIAEKSGVKMPSFFGYMKYSFAVLIPIFILLNITLVTLNKWTLW